MARKPAPLFPAVSARDILRRFQRDVDRFNATVDEIRGINSIPDRDVPLGVEPEPDRKAHGTIQ